MTHEGGLCGLISQNRLYIRDSFFEIFALRLLPWDNSDYLLFPPFFKWTDQSASSKQSHATELFIYLCILNSFYYNHFGLPR